MLLALSNQRWRLQEPADLQRALQQLCAASARILPLSQVLFWWAEPLTGASATALDEAFPRLDAAALQAYLDWLAGQSLPHAQTSRSMAHPHAALIEAPAHLPGAAGHLARLELPLLVGSQTVALLWFLPSQDGHDWSTRELLQASHLARLFEALLGRR
jgi:hypothetical protein